jgi:hypothetical protein
MPRTCTICTHADRKAIDGALVGGGVFRELAAKYRVSEDAIARHKASHLSATLVKAAEAEDAYRADDLLAQARALQAKAIGILDRAEAAGDLRTALSAIREARGNLELLAKLLEQTDLEKRIEALEGVK